MLNRKKSRPLIDYRMTFNAVPGDVRVKSAVVVTSGDVTVKRLPTKIFLYRELEIPAPPKALQPAGAQTIPGKIPITAIEKHPQIPQPKIETPPIEQPEETAPSGMPEPTLPPVEPTPAVEIETQVTAAQELEPAPTVEATPSIAAVEEPVAELSKRKIQREGAQFKVVIRFMPKVKLGRSDFIDAMNDVLSNKNFADLIESVNPSKKHVTVQLYAASKQEAQDTIQMLKDKVGSFAEANVSMQELYRQKASVAEPTPVQPEEEPKVEKPVNDVAEPTPVQPEEEPKVEKPVNDEKPIAVPKKKGESFSLLDLQKTNLSFEEVQCVYPTKEKPASEGTSEETSQEEKLPETGNGVRKHKNNGDPDAQNPQ